MTERWTISLPDDTADQVMQQLEWGDNRSEWVVDAIEAKLQRQAAPELDPIDAVVANSERGSTPDEQAANEALVRTATEWLREQGAAVQRRDAPLEAWVEQDEHPDAPRTQQNVWNDTVVAAWKASRYVEKPGLHTYEWVGEE